jgi:hypothetical protein
MVFANEIRVISVDEFNETMIPAIIKAEQLIQSLEMEFEVSGQQKKPNASLDWKDSGYYAKVRLLSDGKRNGKIKIDVFLEKFGTKYVIEKSYSLSYNGKQGRKLLHGKSVKGKTSKAKECTILSSRSDTIRSAISAGLYANPFILNFLSKGPYLHFSEYLEMLMSPEIVSSPEVSRHINLVKFENTECIRVQIEGKGVLRTTYWLDPARNYAPLAYETINWDEGKETYMSSKKVLKFKKISDAIWIPVKTQSETKSDRGGTRKTITVSKVRVNIKDLEDTDFDLNIPDDYKIVDKTAEKSQ